MLHHWLNSLQNTENSRLPFLPFLFFWMLSYGLGWYVLGLYENYYEPQYMYFYNLMKFSSEGALLEGMFLGSVFCLITCPIQAWLIWQRFGYLPKFWLRLNWLGAILSAYGYPHLPQNPIDWQTNEFINDVFIWFLSSAAFQSLALWQLNPRAWYLLLLGLLNSLVGSILIASPHLYYNNPQIVLMLTAGIQALGTGIIHLHLLENVRNVSKQISKKSLMSSRVFLGLWIASHYLMWVIFNGLEQIWNTPLSYILYGRAGKWYLSAIYFFLMSHALAYAQDWLMRTYSGIKIPYWRRTTVLSWTIAGVCFWQSYTSLSDFVFLGLSFAISPLIQAFLLNRVLRGGYLWAISGVLAFLAVANGEQIFRLFLQKWQYNLLLGTFLLSLSSALLFLWLERSLDIKDGLKVSRVRVNRGKRKQKL